MQVTITYFLAWQALLVFLPFFSFLKLNLQVLRKYKQVLLKFVPKNEYNYSKIIIIN